MTINHPRFQSLDATFQLLRALNQNSHPALGGHTQTNLNSYTIIKVILHQLRLF